MIDYYFTKSGEDSKYKYTSGDLGICLKKIIVDLWDEDFDQAHISISDDRFTLDEQNCFSTLYYIYKQSKNYKYSLNKRDVEFKRSIQYQAEITYYPDGDESKFCLYYKGDSFRELANNIESDLPTGVGCVNVLISIEQSPIETGYYFENFLKEDICRKIKNYDLDIILELENIAPNIHKVSYTPRLRSASNYSSKKIKGANLKYCFKKLLQGLKRNSYEYFCFGEVPCTYGEYAVDTYVLTDEEESEKRETIYTNDRNVSYYNFIDKIDIKRKKNIEKMFMKTVEQGNKYLTKLEYELIRDMSDIVYDFYLEFEDDTFQADSVEALLIELKKARDSSIGQSPIETQSESRTRFPKEICRAAVSVNGITKNFEIDYDYKNAEDILNDLKYDAILDIFDDRVMFNRRAKSAR